MNYLVRISKDDDGQLKPDWRDWHLVDPANQQGPAALCTSEFFGEGESGCEFETKQAKRGGITCPRCLEMLKIYKAVVL